VAKVAKPPAVTGVRLPPDMRERLAQEGNLSDAIKRRLEASFAWDGIDAPTHELLDATRALAGLIYRDTRAAWHTNAYLRAALAEAIAIWMAERVPGDDHMPSLHTESQAWLQSGDSIKTGGRKLVRLYGLLRSETWPAATTAGAPPLPPRPSDTKGRKR
jgi:hypothetical protein